MNKRPLEVCLAVTKGKMPQLLADKDTIKKTPRDKRNLYLAKEGVITPGSEAADGMSKSDLQKRQKAEAEKKAKLKMPHYVVSKTRLITQFRNDNDIQYKLSLFSSEFHEYEKIFTGLPGRKVLK